MMLCTFRRGGGGVTAIAVAEISEVATEAEEATMLLPEHDQLLDPVEVPDPPVINAAVKDMSSEIVLPSTGEP
jgi:hypothetical protein